VDLSTARIEGHAGVSSSEEANRDSAYRESIAITFRGDRLVQLATQKHQPCWHKILAREPLYLALLDSIEGARANVSR
jgi:hypothetical protein